MGSAAAMPSPYSCNRCGAQPSNTVELITVLANAERICLIRDWRAVFQQARGTDIRA
jgi:ferritin-like protein